MARSKNDFFCTLDRVYNFTISHLQQVVILDWTSKKSMKTGNGWSRIVKLTIFFFFAKSNFTMLLWNIKLFCKQKESESGSKIRCFVLALLFGLINDAKDLLQHHLLLIARHYIYTCKQRDTRPNVQMYIQTVQRTVEIERQIAKDHNSLDTFKKKWSRLKTSPL